MSDDFDLRDPDTFVAGTVGAPGQRIFFLQASQAGHVISLKLEKSQVWMLASLLSELLQGEGYSGPAAPVGKLAEPVAAAWTVSRLAAGIDTERNRIVVIAVENDDSELDETPGEEFDPGEAATPDDDEPSESRAYFHLEYALALGFAQQALRLVEEGRDFGMRNGHRPPRS